MNKPQLHFAQYVPEHLAQIELKRVFDGEVPTSIHSEAMTILHGDRPVAIFGFIPFIPGISHVWALTSEEIKKYPIEFNKCVQTLIDFHIWKVKPRRMQMEVKVNYEEGLRWAQFLGFEKEGIMKKYGPDGSDYWLLGRTF